MADTADSNRIDFTLREGHFGIDIENPWAGGTDVGFGRTCDITLDRSDAETLCDWLIELLGRGWQPIETAPKECKVLVWDRSAVIASISEGGYCYTADELIRPTHWMPLPEV